MTTIWRKKLTSAKIVGTVKTIRSFSEKGCLICMGVMRDRVATDYSNRSSQMAVRQISHMFVRHLTCLWDNTEISHKFLRYLTNMWDISHVCEISPKHVRYLTCHWDRYLTCLCDMLRGRDEDVIQKKRIPLNHLPHLQTGRWVYVFKYITDM